MSAADKNVCPTIFSAADKNVCPTMQSADVDLMDLSIVIPVYNEAHKIGRDVQAATAFLKDNRLSGEIIIADDGSPDGTAQVARHAPTDPAVPVRILALEHRGKGHAVRQGMAATRGEFAMFADSGVCVPYEDVLPALELLRNNACDIANGSRKMHSSAVTRRQSVYRRTLSKMFRWVVLRVLGLPHNLTDTQCGFKVYRGDVARRLYGQCVTDGFMFDLEILIRAREQGYRVVEFPVHWAWDPDSRLRPSRILGRSVSELIALKRILAEEKRTRRAEGVLTAEGTERNP
jgi:glycosyltransferase involved in cell wall biosynthesis